MNSLNSSLVDAVAGIAIIGAEREGEAGTGTFQASKVGAGTWAIGVALGLTDGDTVVFGLEKAELIKQEDLWEPLADPIGLAASSLLATLWVAAPRKGAWR